MTKAEYMKEYYKNNKDKWKVDTEEKKIRKRNTQKKHVKKHPERNRTREYIWIEKNFERTIWLQVRRRAKREGIDFDIELSDVTIPEYCPYLGWKITRVWGQGKLKTNASIDRIDPSKGYIKGNIQVLSRQANEMKRDASIDDLVRFARGILFNHSNDFGLLQM